MMAMTVTQAATGRDVYATVTRTLAAISLIASMPLLVLAAAWLPVIATTIGSYSRDLQRPGSPSFIQSTRLLLENAILSTVLYSAALVMAALYCAMYRDPRPRRDVKIWSVGALVAGCNALYWLGAGWFFVLPAIVAVLATFGASISSRAKRTQ